MMDTGKMNSKWVKNTRWMALQALKVTSAQFSQPAERNKACVGFKKAWWLIFSIAHRQLEEMFK